MADFDWHGTCEAAVAVSIKADPAALRRAGWHPNTQRNLYRVPADWRVLRRDRHGRVWCDALLSPSGRRRELPVLRVSRDAACGVGGSLHLIGRLRRYGGEYAYQDNVTQEDGSEKEETIDEAANLVLVRA
jgi:hypothetical protein